MNLTVEQRRQLLLHIATLATDDDAVGEPSAVFLPLPSHSLALRRETVVVEGTRGAGKTALFHLANQLGPRLRDFFDDESIPAAQWVDAFSEHLKHPSPQTLDAHVEQVPSDNDAALRTFWLIHLIWRLVEENVPGAALPPSLDLNFESATTPGRWIGEASKAVGEAMALLDGVERALAAVGKLTFASYDHLDRLGMFKPQTRQRLVRALLAFWLSLATRYRHLRPKIFLRPDLFEDAERSFADASKLRPRSASLDWDVQSLFRLSVRHLANAGPYPQKMRDWLQRQGRVDLQLHKEFGFLPGPMPETKQKALAMALAGEVMGSGARKGFTYRWMPARLKDAGGRIVPRSFLRLLAYTAKHTLEDPPGRGPLSEPKWLVAALQDTSRDRVNELREEYPFVDRLESLKGQTMLMERRRVVAMLSEERRDGFGRDGEGAFHELVRVGVLEIRADGRIDVPDIYRYGYGIKRKGGAAAPR